MSDEPPIYWLHRMLTAVNNGPDYGTGALELRIQTSNLIGPDIPLFIQDYIIAHQQDLFGGYPKPWDFAPSIVFAVIFGIFGLIHLLIYFINFSRGHYFWLSLVWVAYCVVKMVGFALRAYWSKSILRIEAGLTSEIFLIVSSMVIVSFNLILTQRLFTWRHPVGGSRRLFWNIMFALYGIVLIVVGITVMAAAVPYVHFISHQAYRSYKIINMVSSVLIIFYSLTSLNLIALSYFFKPTRKDENLYTYQPWWIESFHPFYFVPHHAAQKAEETFMKRNHNHRHAIRVIAATHHHYNVVEGLTNQRGDLGHNKSLMIVIATTILVFIGALLRCISVVQTRVYKYLSTVNLPIVSYMCWGVCESIVQILYIVGRVDLRFYRPDVLPAKVRAIITAEQSYFPSDNEDEGDWDSTTSISDHYAQQVPPVGGNTDNEKYFDEEHVEKYVLSHDNESEFHF